MKPENPVKTEEFNPSWGQGEFTCIHTLNDEDGAWWRAAFGEQLTITKVQILNRGDCCGKRLEGTKVYIGESICGTVNNPDLGSWVTINCHIKGDFIKIEGAPKKYLHFCGLKVWSIATTEHVIDEEPE